jgi:hypothetical protein
MKRKAAGQSKASTTPGTAIRNSKNSRLGYEEISLLAYSYWIESGGQGGSPEEDWRRAELEIQQRTKTIPRARNAAK